MFSSTEITVRYDTRTPNQADINTSVPSPLRAGGVRISHTVVPAEAETQSPGTDELLGYTPSELAEGEDGMRVNYLKTRSPPKEKGAIRSLTYSGI